CKKPVELPPCDANLHHLACFGRTESRGRRGEGRRMNWDDARIFLAIYRVGTLRGAAAVLQVDQATAGRRLAAMEASLQARLFLRTPGGYVPTAAGELAFAAA